MKRSTTIDLCRALLFLLMMNSHALTIAGVSRGHWLRADFWLPNGWATVAFVVLSGFGVGYIYSTRPAGPARDEAVRRRALEILLVMAGSNAFFAALRLVVGGDAGALLAPGWWIGFLTLDTPWTISGVLMPTALVLLCFPLLCRLIGAAPWAVLAVLACARLAVEALAAALDTPAHASSWAVRFLLLEGFGGFPILPFVLNGALGMWLGMMRHLSERLWLGMMGGLLALQLVIYFGATYFRDTMPVLDYLSAFGALGKFAWMFLVAYAVSLVGGRFLTGMLGLVGQYALGSFVMHRVFLQGLAIVLAGGVFRALSVEVRYVALLIGTLFLTWGLCLARRNIAWMDVSLRRFAL